MPLPAPQPRKHLHSRKVNFCGYQREDGLWDIEAEMCDTKAYLLDTPERGTLPPGTPVHDMAIRVTLDDAMTIVAIATSMPSTPFEQCPQAEHPMQQMVGVTIGPGWRVSVDRVLGGIKGCTHMRELLVNMATAAYQTMSSYGAPKRKTAVTADQPPPHLGKCLSWDFNGPVVLRRYPEFAGWQPLKRVTKAEPG